MGYRIARDGHVLTVHIDRAGSHVIDVAALPRVIRDELATRGARVVLDQMCNSAGQDPAGTMRRVRGRHTAAWMRGEWELEKSSALPGIEWADFASALVATGRAADEAAAAEWRGSADEVRALMADRAFRSAYHRAALARIENEPA